MFLDNNKFLTVLNLKEKNYKVKNLEYYIGDNERYLIGKKAVENPNENSYIQNYIGW